jgi:hypothetical protein
MRSAAIVAMLLAFGAAAERGGLELTMRGSDVAVHPEIHDTELMGTNIGLRDAVAAGDAPLRLSRPRRLLRGGERGRGGRRRRQQARHRDLRDRGAYNNDEQCYDLTICNDATSLCRDA